MGTRYVEATNSNIPQQTVNPGEMLGFRHFGDGTAGRLMGARIQGFDPGTLAYVDLQVDGSGVLQTSGAAGTQYTEDAAAVADPVGGAQIMVRQDTPATLVSANGDNVARRATNYGAAYTQLVTSTGTFIDSVGGGTEYTEDAAAAADPVGRTTILVRADTPGATVSANGDNIAQRGTNFGAAFVQILSSTGSFIDSFGGGTQFAEDAAHVTGNVGTMMLGVRNDASTTFTDADLDYTPIATDGQGRIRIGSVTSMTPGTTAASLGKAEDAGHTTGDTGVFTLGVRNDALATLTNADLDYSPMATDSAGRLFVNPGTTATALGKAEDALHTTGDVGVMALAVRNDAGTALAADGDYIPLSMDSGGALRVTGGGGGTQYTEDAAAAADPVGTANILVRADTPGALVSANGDNVAQRGTNFGAAYCQIVDSSGNFINSFGGAGGTALNDDAAFTVGTTQFTPAGGTYRSVRDLVDDNDGGAFAMTQRRALYTAIETPNGDTAMDETNDALRVNVVADALAATEYVEGATDTTINGPVVMWEDTADTIRATSAAFPLPVNTELAAASALADNFSNPTTAPVGAFLMGWDSANWDRVRADGGSVFQQGDLAHDAGDGGNPVKVGYRAIAHGANPTAVAAADRTNAYANRHGIPFVLGGHMNAVTTEYMATTAQTNDPIVTVSAGTKIVVTKVSAMVDNATTVDVGVRIGFGATTVPTEPADGGTVNGVILSHPGIAAGSGVVEGTGMGIIGIGADDEDLRITNEVPTTGKLRVLVTYFTIES